LAFAAAASLVVLAGCGSGKPAYCTARTNLQNSVKGLTSLSPSSGISGLEAKVKKIQSDAAALGSSAKSDFPSQTSAVMSSVQALEGSVRGLSSNVSAAQIAAVATDAKNVVSSVKSFTSATSSKCG
jgi:hypothetical protein